MTETRHSRRGLIGPFAVAALILIAWTAWWFFLVDQIRTRFDAQAEQLRQEGWSVRYASTTIDGWPFRARLSLPHAEIVAPSGQGVSAPELVAEANAYNPDKWVVIAPDGLFLHRADKGKTAVRGDGLRLSVSHLRDPFPDLRVEAIRPVFTPLTGADPFPIASADRIEFYARPNVAAPAGQALDVKFVLTEARGRSGGPVEGVAQQGRLGADVESTLTAAQALRGPDAQGVFTSWSRAGGAFTAVRGELRAGDSAALLSSERLAADADGRLRGSLSLKAEKPLPAIAGLARSGSGAVNRLGAAGAAAATAANAATGGQGDVALTLIFRDGRTWLGPFALAPAPKLF